MWDVELEPFCCLRVSKINKQNQKVEFFGIDPDTQILRIARNKLKKERVLAKITQAWAEELPFKNSIFDCVVSSLTFHHMPLASKRQALKEINRVLAPKGRFLLADIGKPQNLFWKIKFLVDTERILKVKEYMKDNLDGKLPSLMEEAGFEVAEVGPRHRNIQFLLGHKR